MLPDQAVMGHELPDGSRLRFGRVADPTDPSKLAFLFKVAVDDVLFNDSRRCEAVAYALPGTAIPTGQEFWYAFTMLPAEGVNSKGDGQTLTQWHINGFNPFMALYLANGRLSIGIRHSESLAQPNRIVARTVWTDRLPIQRNWQTFVFRARISADAMADSTLRVWRDGVQIAHYTGLLGYFTRDLPYAKIGYYSWNDRNEWDPAEPIRALYVRRATLASSDPRLTEPEFRAWFQSDSAGP